MMRPEPVNKSFRRPPVTRGGSAARVPPPLPLHPGPEPVYLVNGPFPEFHHLVLKHHLRQEREQAGEGGLPLPSGWQAYQLVEDE